MLNPETMKLLGNTKKDVDQDKDGENIQKLESVEVVLVQKWLPARIKSFFTFFSNKQFGILINIAPNSLTMMNTVNTEFLLLKFGLQTKSVKHSKLKITLIWH